MNIGTGVKTVVEALKGNSRYNFLNGGYAIDMVRDTLLTTLSHLNEPEGKEMKNWRMAVAPRPYRAENFLGIPQTTAGNVMQAAMEQNRGMENNMLVMKEKGIIA